MPKINVHAGNQPYEILIEAGLLSRLGDHVTKNFQGKKIVVVTDENVNSYYGNTVAHQLQEAGFEVQLLALPPGEPTKSFNNLPLIYSRLLDFKMTRSDLLIALGGGVIGDLTGFVAATFLRGIPFIQIPTSLLAQVDSSVGGKVGVNLPEGKNLVGAFCQPKAVLIDPEVLNTLSDKFFRDGMAEVIKYGCIKDRAFFKSLKTLASRKEVMGQIEDIIYRCCFIKKTVVEADERDLGERLLLNFGHSLGHALEKYHNYEGLTHGEAVGIGMYQTTRLSEAMGQTKLGAAEEIKELLVQYGLPYELSVSDHSQILAAIGLDKKNMGSALKEILLKDLGDSFIFETTHRFFEDLKHV